MMQETLSRGILLLVLSAWLPSAMALDPEACQERLKSVDDRIASGKYSAQSVQMAQQMRDSIMQSCAYLDDATIGQMMEGFENLLPTRSEAERQAYEEAKRAKRQAQVETQRAELETKRAERSKVEEKRRKLEAQKPPVPAVLKQPPTGKTRMRRFVDRDDTMPHLTIHDWDHHNGNARILYETYLTWVTRQAPPDARRHFYVLEANADNVISQQHVAEMPPSGYIAAARLRHGYDEVIFQRPTALPGPGSTLERWSISKGESLSSVAAPSLPWSDQKWGAWSELHLTTTDGDILFAGMRPVSLGQKTAIEWLKASPDGEVVGQGILQSDTESIGGSAWFRTRDGGAGLVIGVQSTDDERGLESEIETPLVHNVEGVEIRGVVRSEERLLIIDRNGRIAGQSAALGRSLGWNGMDKLAQLGSAHAMQEASELTSRDGARYGKTVKVRSYNASVSNVDAIAAVGDGYGVLVSVYSAGNGQPLMTGDWLYEYSTDKTVRKTYLKPAGEHLGGQFLIVTATDDDSVYLYNTGGGNGPHVVRLDEDREIAAYSKLSMRSKTQPRGMLADRKGVWVIGDGRTDGQFQKVWLERIDF
jgi:hypothetical protein